MPETPSETTWLPFEIEEVLVVADLPGVAAVRNADCFQARVFGRAVYLHVVLVLPELNTS